MEPNVIFSIEINAVPQQLKLCELLGLACPLGGGVGNTRCMRTSDMLVWRQTFVEYECLPLATIWSIISPVRPELIGSTPEDMFVSLGVASVLMSPNLAAFRGALCVRKQPAVETLVWVRESEPVLLSWAQRLPNEQNSELTLYHPAFEVAHTCWRGTGSGGTFTRTCRKISMLITFWFCCISSVRHVQVTPGIHYHCIKTSIMCKFLVILLSCFVPVDCWSHIESRWIEPFYKRGWFLCPFGSGNEMHEVL